MASPWSCWSTCVTCMGAWWLVRSMLGVQRSTITRGNTPVTCTTTTCHVTPWSLDTAGCTTNSTAAVGGFLIFFLFSVFVLFFLFSFSRFFFLLFFSSSFSRKLWYFSVAFSLFFFLFSLFFYVFFVLFFLFSNSILLLLLLLLLLVLLLLLILLLILTMFFFP